MITILINREARNKESGFGQYKGYSEAIYDGYERRSQYLKLADGTRLAYDLYLPTKDGAPTLKLLRNPSHPSMVEIPVITHP